jgi:hypothetical protein
MSLTSAPTFQGRRAVLPRVQKEKLKRREWVSKIKIKIKTAT